MKKTSLNEMPSESEAKKKKKLPTRSGKKKLFLIPIILLLLCAIGFGIYKLFFVKEEKIAVTGKTTYGALNEAIEGSGTTTPADSITYDVSGKVLEWHIKAGDKVEAGDLLYVLDSSDAKDEILENELELEELYEQLSEIRESIAGQNIVADFSGRIEQIQVQEGKNIQNGATLAQLIDDSYMKATFYFSYVYEKDMYIGKAMTVSVPEQLLTVDGKVTDIQYVDYITPEGMRCFAVTVSVKNPGSLTKGTTVSCWGETDDGSYTYSVGNAQLEYNDVQSVTADATGELKEIHVVNYKRVSKGDLLFEIDTSNYESQLENIQKQIENYEEKIADLQESIETEYTRYSDISGQVVSANYSTNRMTGMDMGSVVIYNQDSMEISVNIDELDADYLYEGMDVYVYRTTSSKTVSYPATLTYLSLEANAGSSGVSTFAATITIDSQGALSSGVTVYYSIDTSDGGKAEETVLSPLNALCTYDNGYYLIVQSESRPEDAIEPASVSGSVTDYPEGYYAIPVEVGDYNENYVQILSGVEQDSVVFLRYQNVAPSGGNNRSEAGEESGRSSFGEGQMPDFGGQMPDFVGGSSSNRPSGGTMPQGGMSGNRG